MSELETWRAGELKRIDDEIARLKGTIAPKQRDLDADVALHLTRMNHDLQSRLQNEIAAISGKVRHLEEQRLEVELADGPPAPARPIAPATSVRAVDTSLELTFKGKGNGTAEDDAWMSDVRKIYQELSADFSEEELKRPPTLRFFLLDAASTTKVLYRYKERFDDMTARLDELEKAPVRYRGVHQKAEQYRRGDVVTAGGSAWSAIREVKPGETPGTKDGADAWQLMVKAGKDAA